MIQSVEILNFDIRLLDRVPQSDLATLESLEISISCLAPAFGILDPYGFGLVLRCHVVGQIIGWVVARVVGLVVTEESWLA